MGKRKKVQKSPQDETFVEEARRLANLPARQRKEALSVHWGIAADTRLSEATRDHARFVAQTLEGMIEKILAKSRK
jgi:hypothetical protein